MGARFRLAFTPGAPPPGDDAIQDGGQQFTASTIQTLVEAVRSDHHTVLHGSDAIPIHPSQPTNQPQHPPLPPPSQSQAISPHATFPSANQPQVISTAVLPPPPSPPQAVLQQYLPLPPMATTAASPQPWQPPAHLSSAGMGARLGLAFAPSPDAPPSGDDAIQGGGQQFTTSTYHSHGSDAISIHPTSSSTPACRAFAPGSDNVPFGSDAISIHPTSASAPPPDAPPSFGQHHHTISHGSDAISIHPTSDSRSFGRVLSSVPFGSDAISIHPTSAAMPAHFTTVSQSSSRQSTTQPQVISTAVLPQYLPLPPMATAAASPQPWQPPATQPQPPSLPQASSLQHLQSPSTLATAVPPPPPSPPFPSLPQVAAAASPAVVQGIPLFRHWQPMMSVSETQPSARQAALLSRRQWKKDKPATRFTISGQRS